MKKICVALILCSVDSAVLGYVPLYSNSIKCGRRKQKSHAKKMSNTVTPKDGYPLSFALQKSYRQDTDEMNPQSDELLQQQETMNGMKKTETLRFGGSMNYTSSTLPLHKESLFEYFTDATNQAILLTGGKEDSTVQHISLNQTHFEKKEISLLIEKWKENAQLVNAKPPNPIQDFMIQVIPSGINLLTVTICPETIVGTKFTMYQEGNTLCDYEVVLIEDDPKAVGPKPLVWLFNKIVYGGNPDTMEMNNGIERNRNEKALLKATAEKVINDEKGQSLSSPAFTIRGESEMMLEFEFPKLLLRFFPLSKNKSEEISSLAISKALELNLQPAIDQFCQGYLKYIE
ncbi:hypothetical protein CTEN210_06575 [Chaetoceros tenuissimus]|uniref:Uncharacterized protein n=1 Tax=Chaetoceros tenuissimus TaxID=426638 RepID=A0AAD3CSZ1_9STRA|nr:hypothetical protein CTEN210_06575 [Chaetoceros tenuissimus]